MNCRLPASHRQTALGPRLSGALLRGGRYQRTVLLQPVLLPRNRGKPFVGEEGIVAVGGQQELPDGSLIRVGLGQPDGSNYPFWSDRECYLEAVDPFGLGNAASEGGLSGSLLTDPPWSWVSSNTKYRNL